MSEKTEKPTPHKLRDAHKRGEVAKSREVTSLASYIALLVLFGAGVEWIARKMLVIVDRAILAPGLDFDRYTGAWLHELQGMVVDAAWILAPVLLIAMTAATLAGLLLTRGVFSFQPLTPKFENISPAKGLKNIFSMKQLFELGKLLVKVTLLTATLFWVATASLDALVKMVYSPATDLLRLGSKLGFSLMKQAAVVYVFCALLDYWHQHYEFMKQQRMTVDEVRREVREHEGDPWIKASRRSTARELIFADPPAEPVPPSDQGASRSVKQNPTPRTV
jgi:type III secretion protein U